MIRFAKMTCPEYDIYKSSGYPYGHPFGGQDAATRIVTDMVKNGYYIDLVETLVNINTNGYMGKRYGIRGLDDVINDVLQAGYNYDSTTGQFFEDQSMQVTRNWGRLMEGYERQMAVIRLDIVGNSSLVKDNSKSLIDKAYKDLRKIVTSAVVMRYGRLWTWEGDGALAAFMLGNYSRMAIFAGMEILNEMFMYNKIDNHLNSDIKLRISVHSGDIVYSEDETKCFKTETVQKALYLESNAALPNTMVISESLAMSQDQAVLDIFSNSKTVGKTSNKYRLYQVSQDKS
jgi:class 3 adenylate cyclase